MPTSVSRHLPRDTQAFKDGSPHSPPPFIRGSQSLLPGSLSSTCSPANHCTSYALLGPSYIGCANVAMPFRYLAVPPHDGRSTVPSTHHLIWCLFLLPGPFPSQLPQSWCIYPFLFSISSSAHDQGACLNDPRASWASNVFSVSCLILKYD